jgi:hypothetical protein
MTEPRRLCPLGTARSSPPFGIPRPAPRRDGLGKLRSCVAFDEFAGCLGKSGFAGYASAERAGRRYFRRQRIIRQSRRNR